MGITTILVIIVIVLAVLAGLYGLRSLNHYGLYQENATYSGVVSSYTQDRGFFGYVNYNLEFYGGSEVNWSTDRNQSLIFSKLGWNIAAKDGQNCTVSFIGAFMKNATCR